MTDTPEDRLVQLKLTLPQAPKAVAVYKTAVQVGNLLYVSGHGPLKEDKTLITGRLGKDMTLEQGYAAAKQTGLAILSTVKETLGSLNKVKRLIKSFGMVNCTDDFLDQPKVINGYGTDEGSLRRRWDRRPQCSRPQFASRQHRRGNRGHLRGGVG